MSPEIGELAHDLLAGDDVARQRGVIAVKEDDDDPALGRIERVRRREQHAAVAVSLVLPMDPAARRGMAKAAIVVDVHEGPRLARLLIVRDHPVIRERRILERGERNGGAVDRGEATIRRLTGLNGRTRATGHEKSRAHRRAHPLRPPRETTLHGLILNNPLAASKDPFKARLQNREDSGPLVRLASGAILAATPLSRDPVTDPSQCPYDSYRSASY